MVEKKSFKQRFKSFLLSLILDAVERDTIHMILKKEEDRADMIGNFIRSSYLTTLKKYFG